MRKFSYLINISGKLFLGLTDKTALKPMLALCWRKFLNKSLKFVKARLKYTREQYAADD